MKYSMLAICISISLAIVGCLNSSTAFTNRSVVYQVTPENLGEHSAVTGSPTTNDATVNAEKSVESAAKTNVAQQLTDNSSNAQMNPTPAEEKKDEPAKAEK